MEKFRKIKAIEKVKVMEYNTASFPEKPVAAMAYVPFQQSEKLYSPEQGLFCGTMFPVLDKPFLACGGMKK